MRPEALKPKGNLHAQIVKGPNEEFEGVRLSVEALCLSFDVQGLGFGALSC